MVKNFFGQMFFFSEFVLNVSRNLHLKFHQNWVSNGGDIEIEFLWGGGVQI